LIFFFRTVKVFIVKLFIVESLGVEGAPSLLGRAHYGEPSSASLLRRAQWCTVQQSLSLEVGLFSGNKPILDLHPP
jgi:hypothetical protein